MDCSPPDSSVHRILQGRILEWLPFPSPGDLPHPGVEPESPELQADFLPSEPLGKPLGEPAKRQILILKIRGMDYFNPCFKSY